MSKAFTKDDDAGDAPLVLPRCAPLPNGVPNYVTARGLAQLRQALADAKSSEPMASSSDAERARHAAVHAAFVAELEERLACAELVDHRLQPKAEVRFGATVKVQDVAANPREYRIVGVDEANAAARAIAFVAPLARALLGKRVGDAAIVRTPAGEDELEILAISYE